MLNDFIQAIQGWYSVWETVTVELMAQCMNIQATGCEADITVKNVGLRDEVNELMFARLRIEDMMLALPKPEVL